MTDVTRILSAIEQGDPSAAEQLLPLVYDELRGLARHLLRQERPEHTLQPTALVHEAFLRMVDQTNASWNDRTHFLAVAATAMRQILSNHARSRAAAKRDSKKGRKKSAKKSDEAKSPDEDESRHVHFTYLLLEASRR